MHLKTGVLLLNLGTPDSTSTPDVRKYLREFLMDERVIDIPFLKRWMLVNLIIAPLRAPKSAEEYKKVWTDEGSPLLVHGRKLKELLQEALGTNYVVALGMRYQNPSIEHALDKFKNKGFKQIIVIPLYPQYASATTGSTIQKVNEILNDWQVIPELKVVSNYVDNNSFIDACKEIAQDYKENEHYDHFVFSYHGLPERQIKKAACDGYCQLNDKCCAVYHAKNHYCYRAQCYETTRRLAEALNIKKEDYTVCFQSRLGKDPWIQPYIDDVVPEIAKKGIKKVLAFSPAFVADCLETTIEIGETYMELFQEHGGEKWQLVESLNTHPSWVKCLAEMVLDYENKEQELQNSH